jgi:hypothetical protein
MSNEMGTRKDWDKVVMVYIDKFPHLFGRSERRGKKLWYLG